MTDVEIRGYERPLQKIFCDDFVFSIPPYQRPYSWTTDEAGELLDDLLDALGDDNPDEADPYFLGSIVLAKEKDAPPSDVIDGQQRLTTLTLLLSGLTEVLPETEAREVWSFIRQEGRRIVGQEDVPRLNLRPRDREFFRTYTQQEGGLHNLLELDPDQLSDPERNIQENAILFLEELESLPDERPTQLVKYLLTRCYLVVVSTPDRDSAYRVFKVLNDRGLDLSHTDILKSEIIGKIDGDLQQKYTDRWENAEEELGRDPFEDLFAHIRMIFAKTKQKTTVLDEFRTYVVDQVGEPAAVVDTVIVPYADLYADILNTSWSSVAESEPINRYLTWLHRLDNVDWIPPTLKFIRDYKEQPAKIADFLERLERLAASMYIRRVYVGGRIKRYGRLLDEMESATADVLSPRSSLDLTEEEKRKTVQRLAGQVYDVRRTRQYVLLRLDSALSEGTATYDYKTITVEHVLPQNPRTDSGWVDNFTEDQRIFWTHRLANLVLLSRRKNSDAQNYDFTKKKEKYFKSEKHGVSPFPLTTEVIDQDTWTPNVLEDRQRRLVQELATVWELGQTVDFPTAPQDLPEFQPDEQ